MARNRMSKEQRTRQIYFRLCFILAIVAIAATVLYMALVNAGKTVVNLNERTHLTLTGFNGEGMLSASFDVDETCSSFFETVHVDFSKFVELSNGDEITISYTYSEEMADRYNLKVKCQDMHYTVNGLVDPVPISKEEMFDGVTVEFEGIAPMVEVKVNSAQSKYDNIIKYEVIGDGPYYDLGDSVKVRAVFDEEELAELDYVAEVPTEECIQEYVVKDVDRYITSTDEVTDDIMASLKKEALSLFTDANEYGMRIFCDAGLVPVYINKKTTFVWSNTNYISSYLNVLKEESFGKTGTHVNDIKLCFESVISQADGKACRAEVVVRFQDIIIRADGTVDLNLESGDIISADRRDSHIKALVNNAVDNDYESEKISA